jgi:hypothetical protein
MWQINDYMIINFILPGDVISWEDTVFQVTKLTDQDEEFLVEGVELNWNEEVEFNIPDARIVPVFIQD